MKDREIFIGTVSDLTSDGAGVIKIDGFPYFVDGVIPGETIEFKILNKKKNFGFGALTNIIEKSDERAENYSEAVKTGLMNFGHIKYEAQLKYKKKQVKDAFRRIGKFDDIEVCDVEPSKNIFNYRNKAQTPVREVDGELEIGAFEKNSRKLIPLEKFYLNEEGIDEALLITRDILRNYGISAYDEEKNEGLRHIIIKRGHYTGEIMITLVTKEEKIPHEREIIRELAQKIPKLVSVTHNIQDKNTSLILGKKTKILYGDDFYRDNMMGFEYKISTESFFQINTPQAEKIYKMAIDALNLTGREITLDAYCGIGTISSVLSEKSKKVYGVEIVEKAIKDARENAKINGIDNIEFESGRAEDVIKKWIGKNITFDAVVVDPPRKGLDEKFLDSLIKLNPPKISYISCNPVTQARDCRKLKDAGYKIEKVKPVDFFPQTSHVEIVCLMSRK